MTETTITVWKDGEAPVNLLQDDDKTYLPVPATAAATGVTKRSLLRIITKNSFTFAPHVRDVPLSTPGGQQVTTCIDRDGAMMLLFKLSTNHIKSPETRKRLDEFRAWQIRKMSAAPVPALPPALPSGPNAYEVREALRMAKVISEETGLNILLAQSHALEKMGLDDYAKLLPSGIVREAYLNVTDIAEKIGKTPAEVNVNLWQYRKLQVPDSQTGEYRLTPAGREYGDESPYTASNGHKGIMIRWRWKILELFNMRVLPEGGG